VRDQAEALIRMKSKIFISSVQSEFAHERKALAAYIREDAMLGDFFEAGSGTGVIVDKCVEQGLTRPDFDPTVGFFKTVIWREGTRSAPSRGTQSGPSQGARSKGPSRETKLRDQVAGPSRRGRVVGAHSKGPSQGGHSRRGPVAGAQSRSLPDTTGR